MKKLLLLLLLVPWLAKAQTTVTGNIMVGTLATRPAACSPGDQYNTTDGNGAYLCGPTPNIWGPFGGSLALLPNIPITFSATPVFPSNGISNNAYSIILTGNVTSSTISGTPTSGNVLKLHICQGAGGPWTFAFPGNFLNTTAIQTTSCTDETFSFDGVNWSQLTQPSGGAGGGGACSAVGGQGVFQAAGTAGACQSTNLSESGGVLTNGDDNINRGPNPSVDLRKFGVRAVNPNAIPAPTATINSGTNSAVVSANTGLQIGDGFSIVGAGATQSMTTPTAPTVTPSCASQLTGLGYTVPAGAGATAYQYQIAMRDVGQGLTAASSVGTTSTGNATLGANSTAWTSSASGTSNVFTATVGSTANLAAGCMVLLKGSTDDAEFGGWKIVASVTDGTHFTYTSGIDASRGISTTTATGGTVSYWLCNHVVLPTPGAGGIQYLIYGRTSGSNVYLANSLIANLGYTDPEYNTWDDFGSPMMDNVARSWWVPNTPPGSPVNDTLVTTITNIAGTTLTLAANASNSVAGTQARFDNAAPIANALIAVNNTSTTGAGGTIRFPVVVENSGTGSYCYVISTYLVISANAVIQDGSVCLDDTVQLTGNWYGTDLSAPRMLLPTFGFRNHIPLFVFRANPGIYLKGGGISKVDLSISSNGAVGVFNAGGASASPAEIFEDDTFTSSLLAANDYMSIAFYDYENTGGQGGFGGKFRNCSFITGGTNNAYGSTATPIWASKYSLEWDFDYISGSLRGFAFVPFHSGLFGKFRMGEEMQGPIMPILNFLATNTGNTSGAFLIDTVSNDTGAVPLMAYFPSSTASLSADFVIEGGNLPSSGEPLISGSQFPGSIAILALTTATQTGQNVNVTNFSKTSNAGSGFNTGGLRTPGIRVDAVSYSTNHTLGPNEGAVNATATLTFTAPHAIRGQIWQVFSNSGTTTLSIDSGTLHGNAATGNIVIPNNTGVTAYCDGTDCYAFGLGGGGGGGGCTPGGTTDALLYNGGGGVCAGVNSPTANGNYNVHYRVTASAAVPPAIDLPGVPINVQTGTTYTIGTANTDFDRGYLITANNAGAQTYTFVNPSTTGYGFNHFFVLKNIGTGTVTASASGFTINGAASLLIAPSWTVFFWSDGVNYFASRLPDFTAFPNCVGGGNALQFTTATGVFSCGSSSAGVSSITGDGIVISNSLSTGAVTLTLATAAPHKFLMNNTAGTAAPGYQSPGKADLLGTIVYTDQANTMGAFLFDLSAGTFKPPAGAGATAGASSQQILDTTAKIWHFYQNNADSLLMATTATDTTVTHVAHATAVPGIYVFSAIASADLPAQYTKGSCTELWGGSGTSFALTTGDDAISNNSCYNDSGGTRTITAVKCRSDNASNTTTVNPTFGAAGTGTTILSGALTCGSSLAYSSTGTVTNASWTTGTGINPVMAGTLTGTSIAMIVEYTF